MEVANLSEFQMPLRCLGRCIDRARPVLAESSHSVSTDFHDLSDRSWEKQTLSSIRFAQNQPLSLSGECPLYPNTSHSDVRIYSYLSGCF